jgi:hypothetical protein
MLKQTVVPKKSDPYIPCDTTQTTDTLNKLDDNQRILLSKKGQSKLSVSLHFLKISKPGRPW